MKNRKTTDFENKLLKAVSEFGFKPSKILVGFSGGSDSMSLLHCLTGIYGKDRVAAMHINHMIRGQYADSDEEFCRKYCLGAGIDFYSEKIDVLKICGGSAIEETARNVRYKALCDKARETGCDSVALAHTADDNAETLMFNLSRGCGLSGMGIPPVRSENGIMIIRPAIFCTKKDVLDYIKKYNLEYVTDQTNFDTTYSRNNIRENVIPVLEEIKNGAVENISEFSERARSDENFIDGYAEEYMKSENPGLISGLTVLHKSVLSRVLMKMFAVCSEAVLSYKNITDIEKLVSSEKNGSSVSVAGKYSAVICDGCLRFLKQDERSTISDRKTFSFEFNGDDLVSDEYGFKVTKNRPDTGENERLFSASLPGRFIIRSREPGDTIYYGTITKAIKKMTTEVPLDARKRRPVFETDGTVIWYPGSAISDHIKNDDGRTVIYYVEKIQ